MAKGNRVDEVDNQIETTEFVSESGLPDEEFEEESPDSGVGDDADLTEVSCDDAVRANPKRLSAAQRNKASAIIEGLIDDAELTRPDGQRQAWQTLYGRFDPDHARPFDIRAQLNANDVIEHPKFGIGFVVEQISPRKVEVLFSEELKRLACNIN